MPLNVLDLQNLSFAALDDLFRKSPPGDIPAGNSRGTALLFPGSFLTRPLSFLIRLLFWQGKIFRPNPSHLVNKITPFHLRAVKAAVYKAPSWLDGQEAIVLDYSKTSWLAWFVRDEIRLAAPGLYLGKVWVGHLQFIHFAVEFPASTESAKRRETQTREPATV